MTFTAVLRRAGAAVLVLWASFTLAFILLTALPGDAVSTRYADPELGLSPEEIAEMRDAYGSDEPVLTRYWNSLTGVLHLDFGNSLHTGADVTDSLLDALPGTLALALTGFLLAVVIAVVVAVTATSLPDNPFCRRLSGLIRSVPPLFISLPAFWLGIILIQVFSFSLEWVPVIHATTVQQLILPSVALALPLSAPLAQVLLRSIDDVTAMPFVTVVRARGAGPAWVLWRNVLRNAVLPAMTVAGLTFGELVGGAVVTEAVFSRAGIGAMTVDAVSNRDTPVLMAVVVLAAAVYVVINLVVDLLYPVLDARLRTKKARA
ncbi:MULTISPECIES: ABC transporter permease [Corynebacterium]|jgi:peptide/nickel transport system permease protein|uniref:ABC transporter permease n=1 Tax=Corynebacterium TaxID=1716 RepID=UPI000832F422|nr:MULTISPECIES: ABC transporter permease [Corynebacterium]MCI1255705.1 ABC transporter permease [Corynebacterium provencense]